MAFWSLAGVLVVLGLALGAHSATTFQHTAKGPFFSLPLTIGDRNTKLNVAIDGYYGATMVYGPGSKCSRHDRHCIPHAFYDYKRSRTWKQSIARKHFEFSMGTSDGPAGTDRISIGPLKLASDMLTIGEQMPRHMNRKCMTSGFVAMWAPEMEDHEKTTMQLFVEKADRPVITFHGPSDLNGDHTITIGKEDTMNCGDFVPLKNQPALDSDHKAWTILVDKVQWGNKFSTSTRKETVALNVGADYFVAPRQHAEFFSQELGATHDSNYSGQRVNCRHRTTAPPLVFRVANRRYVIPPTVYIKRFPSGTCLLNIYPDDLDMWTLPYMFHQLYCVRYDYATKMVGFAPKK